MRITSGAPDQYDIVWLAARYSVNLCVEDPLADDSTACAAAFDQP
jgi:hypothetical protein